MDGINERIGSDCKLPQPVGGLCHNLSKARWRAGIYIIITASPTSLPPLCVLNKGEKKEKKKKGGPLPPAPATHTYLCLRLFCYYVLLLFFPRLFYCVGSREYRIYCPIRVLHQTWGHTPYRLEGQCST